ncbi:MAG: hypothetical protein SNJ74_09505 [Fimbriimonadaceae bacterium]
MSLSLSHAEVVGILVACAVAFGVSAIAAAPVLRLLIALKSRQTVSRHLPGHQGKSGTPTMGGLIVVLGLAAAILATPALERSLLVLVLGFAVIGFWDDFVVPRLWPGKRGLGWKEKLILQFAVTGGWVWLAGAASAGAEVAFGAGFVVLFWANAYNFADGLDGLAAGLGIWIALGIAACAFVVGMPSLALVALALVAAMVPFAFLNAPPAKVFMGDVGSLPVGALLGALLVGLVAVEPQPLVWVAAGLLSLIMAVELVPVPLQILSVKIRKKRLFPKTPIHHALEDAGWPETRIVSGFVLAQVVLSAAAAGAVLFSASRQAPSPTERLRSIGLEIGWSDRQPGLFVTEPGRERG